MLTYAKKWPYLDFPLEKNFGPCLFAPKKNYAPLRPPEKIAPATISRRPHLGKKLLVDNFITFM